MMSNMPHAAVLTLCWLAAQTYAGGPLIAPEMVVTPTRTAVAQVDVPAAIEVIPYHAIELQGPGTVDALFRSMAGIELQGSDFPGLGVKLNMRGLTSGFQTKRVLVMQDGRRLNEQYQGNVEFMTLPADNVDRIEVVRGPGSALYGSGAMGGVVNIITRRGTGTPETAISTGYGTHNTWRSALRHSGSQGDADYAFAGGFVDTDGYLKRQDGQPLDWQAYNLAGNAGWKLSESASLRLYLGGYRGDGAEFSADRKARKDYQMGEFNLNWLDAHDGQLQIRMYRNGQRDEYAWVGRGTGLYDQETLASEVVQSLWITPRQRLSLGSEIRREAVDIQEVDGDVDEHSTVTALFLQDEWFVTDSLQLQAGLRVDRNSDYATAYSPRLAMLLRLSPASEWYASYNRAHRAPALADRYARAVFWNMLFIGNPDLEPETLDAYETGIRHRISDRLSTEATVFFNDMRDSYESVYIPELDAFRPENVSNSQTYGVELSVRGTLTHHLEAFANYTFTEGEYVKDPNPAVEGNRITYLARHKANAGITLDAGRAGQHELSLHVAGHRYADVENTPENRLDGYTLAHWSSRVRLAPYTWFHLAINNLTDESYRHFTRFEQPGRIVSGSLEMLF